MARNDNSVGWFYESASERKTGDYAPKSTFANYQQTGTKTLEENFNQLYETYKKNNDIDIRKDIREMLSNRELMNDYKEALTTPVFEGFREMSPNDPHIESIIENVNKFWDNKVRLYSESASLVPYLPIASLEFPVLLKQFFQTVLKDIIEIETVKTPNITKHIRTTYMVNNETKEEYEYPKCLFDGTWQKLWEASKGHKIRETVVPLTDGRLFRYNIITNLTDGTPGIDQLTFQFKIIGIKVGTEIIPLRGNGITVEFSTGGTFVNGNLDFEHNGTKIQDNISGQVNFKNGTVDLSSASGQVEGVVFSGYLSNEKNLRHISVREKRDILRFTIEDGPRWNMPFSIEEIEDASALLDINYYNRMVDEIVKTQEMQETMTVIKFLNDEFAKYHGVNTDMWNLESLAMTFDVDLNPPSYFAGDPFKYISTAIQFKLKAIIHQLTEITKLEGLSFIIAGNPMACQLISEFIQWKAQQGSTYGGITVNNSYGISTDMSANIRIVASNIFDAYTVEPYEGKRELILHIYVYPTNPENISFRHLKYTSHLLTSQSQTAYQSTQAPGGAYNIVTSTSRFRTIAIQGIQARLVLKNSDKIYGSPPNRPPVIGAPWA
jgi:hypothetical protein